MIIAISLAVEFGIALRINEEFSDEIIDGISLGIIGGIMFGILFGMGGGIAVGVAFGVAYGVAFLRAYYWPIHLFFVWPRLHPTWYNRHPIAWDDLCGTPLPGFDRLLAAYAELDPEAGQREITRLIDEYPAQRMAGLRAQARFIARNAGAQRDLSRLDVNIAGLPEGEKGFLAHTARLKSEIAEIASLQRRLNAQSRRFLNEPEARLLVAEIRNVQSRVSGYPEPLGSEFRLAAGNWLKIAEAQHEQLRGIVDREPRAQVFRAGDPVDREQEAFIPRYEVLGELDRQLSLGTGCPGVILYGRRRMGKSTLLQNLDGFLPISTRIAVISMQRAEAFASQESFFELIGRYLRNATYNLGPDAGQTATTFFNALDLCNRFLADIDERLLLAIDEYEYIDQKISEGVFSEDILMIIRDSIQYHRRIIWVFSGNHAIEELRHAPWSSYLISARTVEVLAFTEAETRLLLTEPMRHSRLFEHDESKRPRFEPGFWGKDGIERIYSETAGWPHLVQLLAETAVDLCNERQCPTVDAALLDAAITKAVTAGDTVLRQLLRGESSEAEWAWLTGFRRRDTLPIPEDESVYQSLRRRWLVVDAGQGEWRLRVPLLLRWLRERG